MRHLGIIVESSDVGFAHVAWDTAVDHDNGFVLTDALTDIAGEVFQRVSRLGENDELAAFAGRLLQLGATGFIEPPRAIMRSSASLASSRSRRWRSEWNMAAGEEASRRCGIWSAKPVPPLVVAQIVEVAHLVAHVLRDRGIELCLQVGELVLDRVRFSLGEKWRTVELSQLLLGEAPHEAGHVHLARALARPALKTVIIEKAHEQLEVGIIAIVRRRGHQQECRA